MHKSHTVFFRENPLDAGGQPSTSTSRVIHFLFTVKAKIAAKRESAMSSTEKGG